MPPSGPPGLTYPLPKVGELYRPNVYLPEVRALDFTGRARVQAWQQLETTPADAPKERHGHIMRALDEGALDPPIWVRVPVVAGLEIEAAGDVVSLQGVRICGPMRSHQAIADAWGGLIPTPKICDAIWRARTLTLAPEPVGWQVGATWTNPGGGIPWLLYYADRVGEEIHARAVELALREGPGALHPLVLATLSKDYVLTPELLQHPGECAIYGWHRADGTVIQSPASGASFAHYLDYFDYSHDFRIVRRRCWVEGKEADLADVYRTRPDWVNHRPGQGPCPVRHPALPVRPSSGTTA